MTFKTSENTEELYKSLLLCQNDLMVKKKDMQGKFLYLSLESLVAYLKPILTTQGIIVLQPLINIAIGDKLEKAILTRIQKGKEFMQASITLTEIKSILSNSGKEVANVAQYEGMNITYMRRYALISFVCLAAGDVDFDSSDLEKSKPLTQEEINGKTNDIERRWNSYVDNLKDNEKPNKTYFIKGYIRKYCDGRGVPQGSIEKILNDITGS